jgi:thiamine-monophosphate kinase
MAGEFERIARLAARFGPLGSETLGLTLGIGDDAAILEPSGKALVWTVDAQVDGQHFRRTWLSFEDIGWRSFVAAASDLTAMGARAWVALTALNVPGDVDDDALDALAQGQADAARAVGAAIVGGNLSASTELSVTTTLLGHAGRPVRREGARPGDGLWLAGAVGMARLGLEALKTGRRDAALVPMIDAFARPPVLARFADPLASHATSAIDVSDGLAQDAGHLAAASGVGVVFDRDALRAHGGDALAHAGGLVGVAWEDAMLNGGEDYALLASSSQPLEGFTHVGEVVAERGVWMRDAGGVRAPVRGHGFDHFAR